MALFLSGPEVTLLGSTLNILFGSHLHLLSPLFHPVLPSGAPPIPSGHGHSAHLPPDSQLLFLLTFPQLGPYYFFSFCVLITLS